MEQDLRKIITLDPTSSAAYNTLGYTLADRTNRYQEAYELIQRAFELAPEDPAIIDSLGWVQYRLGMLEEAHKNLVHAYELFPDPEVAAHLGEVLWVIGERNEATRVWRNALEVEPNSSHIMNVMQRLNAGASL
jgi:Flp pilus assembly protein TadD